MSKKLGLALGGGGACGIAHVGVLQIFEENNIPIDIICGTSMGGIVGGLYAAGLSLQDISVEALKLQLRNVMDIDPLFYKNNGLLVGKKVDNILRRLIGDVSFNQLAKPFCCTAVDILSGELCYLHEGSVVQALRATSAIPGIFRPIEIGDKLFIDGGAVERVPCKLAREMGADTIIGVDVLGAVTPQEKPTNLFEFIVRAFNIMDWQISGTKRCEADLIFDIDQPEVNQMKPKNLDKGIEYGRQTALAHLDEIKELVEKL